MNQLLLDTNAYSDFVRNHRWQNHITDAQKIFLPLIVVGELKAGFFHGTRLEKNELVFQNFISQGNVILLSIDFQTTHYYSILFSELKRNGFHIPQNDIWIAALAIQHNLWLCTSDAHFDHIPQLLRAVP